ncbi:MAG: urate oxidase [Chloroflexi bacterium]|nr:urate oxidase [Chloroflexota bacterium]
MKYTISYGKGNIALYRSFSGHLEGLTPIPESPFTGRQHGLFAVDLEVEVFGSAFLPAYTHGDNSKIVATATMTNFALQKALTYPGATLEGFLYYLGQEYLNQYPDMESLRLTANEIAFPASNLTGDSGVTLTPSDRLFAPQPGSYGFASINVTRDGGRIVVTSHECGRKDIKLFKLTGNAFANFARDSFTTLPEKTDRPLYIYLDMGWKYGDFNDALQTSHAKFIHPQQVYDHIQHTFHDFVNMSIQHLIHEMGTRLLDRFPQMSEVSFNAQNRLFDTAAGDVGEPRVFMDPRPPYGMLNLKITR